jgi:hypothetical protein
LRTQTEAETAAELGVSANGKWQRMRRWEANCDPTLAFESKFLIEGLRTWREIADGNPAPPRSALTARALKSFIGHVVIFESVENRWFIRLMGTRLSAVLGEMQGRFVDEAVGGLAGRRWKAALEATLSGMQPLRFQSRVSFRELDHLKAEILLAPLFDELGKPTMAFCVITFNVGFGAS